MAYVYLRYIPRMMELGGFGLVLLEVEFSLLVHDGIWGGLGGRRVLGQTIALDW